MNFNIEIPKIPELAIKMLLDSGFEAGVVGGCTRDALMGKVPHDWDICTSATPQEIQSVFKNFKMILMGLKHGTVVVLIDKENIEITTYRIDGDYSDGRRPDTVCFTRSLIEDLSRRDYTQNAIFYNETQGIIDPFNGRADIEDKVLKCVGNPDIRLKEDALRIIRGLRFASKLGFEVEKSTKIAMFNNKELLSKVSQERITVEFVKLLQGQNAMNVLDEFQEIIAYIIPETKAMMGFQQHNPYHCYDVWQHTLVALSNCNNLIEKLTMFFHDIGKPSCFTLDARGVGHFYKHPQVSFEITTKIFKRMKFTTAEGINSNDLKDILELIKYHDYPIEPKKNIIKKVLSKLNGNLVQFERLLSVKKADALAQAPDKLNHRLKEIQEIELIFHEVIKDSPCTTIKDLAITGSDLINLGIPVGEQIGKILKALLEQVINEQVSNEKDILLKEAGKYL
ncbi:CCA tRNA nucleotidyltransferase [Clostridium grantii]|uniref:tRNA nucleotidyltransferase (CCA-adding enzyme) n=1 Tax=Clostridium grantii DSM 8605 TaxID=1121316 RepID=A0A1M5SBA3_9CLOT|nr:HD domain-containing protein [Clostridium grantii]SHH35568.1 tRNA nucleotidyltransferase (CCA-adding enzyme) [Clostridium grantii DSM 8605]